jgi:Spy/CpxP family protein refolding chaperone
MNRWLALGTSLIVALAVPVQQVVAGPPASATQGDVPAVEQMLTVLTAKLDLTVEQQARITPILQRLHDAQQTLMQDQGLSGEERLARVRPHRYKANEDIRGILTDDQKRKFDQYLQGTHPEMHGNLSGAESSRP